MLNLTLPCAEFDADDTRLETLPQPRRVAALRPRGLDWARVMALSGAFLAHALGFAAFWLAMSDAPPLQRPSAAPSADDHDRLTVTVELEATPPPPLPQPLALPAPPPAAILRLARPVPPQPLAEPTPVAIEVPIAPAAVTAPAVSQVAVATPAANPVSAPPASVDPARARDERAAYVRALMAALIAQRTYPAEARRQRARGVVSVRFTLDRQGHVLASSIARSPGHAILEQAALDVLRRADPLPAIPDALGVDRLTVTVPIEYSLITR